MKFSASELRDRWQSARTSISNFFLHRKFSEPALGKTGHFMALKNCVGIGAAIVVGAGSIYGILSQTTGAPNLNANYDNVEPPTGANGKGSQMVAVLSAILNGELKRGWNPSQSFLHPAHWRYDTAGYQIGKIEVVKQMTNALTYNITYGGSRQGYDADLYEAASDTSIPADIWMPNYGPDYYYAKAVTHLDAYNKRLADGKALFPGRVNDVETVLDVLMGATGNEYNKLGNVEIGFFLTGDAREAYYRLRGSFSAACAILTAAQTDFKQTISYQNAAVNFQDAVKSTCAVAKESVLTGIYYPYLTTKLNGFRGDASDAIGNMQNAYSRLAGGASPR